jgi:hypothetical protein
MKIKGSIEFFNIEQIKENLKKLIEKKSHCLGIGCDVCVFGLYEDGKDCDNSTIFKSSSKNKLPAERQIRAREILKEIEELEKDEN